MLSKRELEFITRNEVCRLATVDESCRPHLVPVCYIYHDGAFYIATDLSTKKLRNIKRNRAASLLVDVYKPNRAVLVEGEAEVLLRGEEYRRVYRLFYERFDWVRRDPWGEGEAAFIKIRPIRKISWGLRGA